MMKLEKRERANALFEHYGALLTDREQKIFQSYFIYDLSLSEIGEQEGVSRASISEMINKALDKLEVFEAKLGICLKCDEASRALNKAKSAEDYKKIVEDLIDGI